MFRGTKRGSGSNAGGEDRGVALHPQLLAVLANLPGERQGRIFLTHRGRPYADKHRHGGGQIWTGWRAACRRAGITDLRPHDLRHTCSTWLTHLGVHEQVRDQITGHYSSSMGRRYAHIPRPDITAADLLHHDRRRRSAAEMGRGLAGVGGGLIRHAESRWRRRRPGA